MKQYKELVDTISQVIRGEYQELPTTEEVIQESIGKDSAELAGKMVDVKLHGEYNQKYVDQQHKKHIEKYGKSVAAAIHRNASHEAKHNVERGVRDTGRAERGTGAHSASKKVHDSFVKKHLGGHGSNAHKEYHAHMDNNHITSISESVVNKPSAEEPTAYHGSAERGNKGDVTPPTQGSSNTEGFKMEMHQKVSHPAFGEGNVLATMGEGVDAVSEVMFKESLKRVYTWELSPIEETEE